MANDGGDDYVFYGTSLEREENLAPSKRKQALDKGQVRTLSSWQQEVLDENGRRRFHGAFTGGFSAGYFNTVGSKEGWTPKTFTSSRKKRAGMAQQTAYDFMDEDEKEEQDSTQLGAASEFDTFGFTTAEVARREAAQELKKRPSAIPGLPPDEIIVPVSESIGVKLLLKMGWRHGRAIGPSHIAAAPESMKEGRKAMLALTQSDGLIIPMEKIYGAERPPGSKQTHDGEFEDHEDTEIVVPSSTPIYVINPKNNLHGLGFDPYKDAPEFRERKRPRLDEDTIDKARSWRRGPRDIVSRPSLFRPHVGRMGSGFGIGALEELDEEDEDVYAPGAEVEVVASDEEACPSSSKGQQKLVLPDKSQRALPGFKPALISECKAEWFIPPVVPPDFVAIHKFPASLESESATLRPEPAEVPPPEDTELCKMIEGLATFVARSGQNLENLYREKKSESPLFKFLSGGYGHEYYRRRLWEEQRKVALEGKCQAITQNTSKEAALNSEQRGKILGEIPLERKSGAPAIAPDDRARLQSALSSTFTKSTSQAGDVARSQLFKGDPAKQARFEQYFKDKFQGGLRSADTIGGTSLTERERALERLEFEAACHMLEKTGASTDASNAAGKQSKDLQALMGDRFTSQIIEKPLERSEQEPASEKYPRREEQPWRPAPLLCKRFNLLDPYAGKPPPLPKPRSRTESFILVTDPVKTVPEVPFTPRKQDLPASTSEGEDRTSSHVQDITFSSSAAEGIGEEAPVQTILEKPVDLYKAIFSDDSEDDEEDIQRELKHEDKSEEAAQAALNRLEAGDFLTSLGKELGLKVPPPESSQGRRGKDSVVPTMASNLVPETIAGSQHSRLEDQKQLSELGSVKYFGVQPSQVGAARHLGMEFGKATVVNTESLDGGDGKNSTGARKMEILHESREETIVSSIIKHQSLVEQDGQCKGSRVRESSSQQQSISEGSSSEDERNLSRYERERRESKKRKDRKDSKRHKRRKGKDRKERKRDRGKEHGSHKHHHSNRRHHKSRDTDNLSSASTSSS